MSQRYESPEAFRQALQARLRAAASQRDLSVQDLQIKFLIERLLARLFRQENPPWVLNAPELWRRLPNHGPPSSRPWHGRPGLRPPT